MENEDWKKKFLETKTKEIGKGAKPLFKGTIEEYAGKMRISLWATDEFKIYLRKLGNE